MYKTTHRNTWESNLFLKLRKIGELVPPNHVYTFIICLFLFFMIYNFILFEFYNSILIEIADLQISKVQ